ncbi:hypothetical protein [Ruminococcus sp.]|jgi:hypothetical protein|nr:hypothetical protein [Ruminococcus sp.]
MVMIFLRHNTTSNESIVPSLLRSPLTAADAGSAEDTAIAAAAANEAAVF